MECAECVERAVCGAVCLVCHREWVECVDWVESRCECVECMGQCVVQ